MQSLRKDGFPRAQGCEGGEGDSDSKDVNSSYKMTYKMRSRVRSELVEEIYVKMELLEEESRVMKEVVLGCVEDRALLMREISHYLSTVKGCLRREGSPLMDGRKYTGLLGVLQEELSPSLVSRDLKIKFDAFKS